ncbi:hypothetical protein ECC02_011432 [Trypanosoma cruzi]|uniref:Uncharacterized protein n=1 Tax=Trypanosoma cruzi TaxID=5693 RepID=A0A7J6XNS7_TRYCR|nr:hypothetical protein ECC02_011432 [Trypanosoma cruzi]
MPCCNHSHRETRKSVWMCAESTATVIAGGGHRGTVRHASAHTEQRTHTAKQKQRAEKNDPKSRQHFLAWRASCSRVSRPQTQCKRHPTHPSNGTVIPTAGTHAAASPFQHGMQANVPPSPRAFLQSTVQILLWVCWRSRKEEGHREAHHQHSKRQSWTAAIHAARPQPQQSRTVAAHTHRINKRKKTRRQGVAVCVALRVSARSGRNKNKTRGKKCVLRPTGPRRTSTRHGSLSAPFVAAPPHACSRLGAQGRRHERVGGCASGAVGRETHGTSHRKSAEETIKRGKSRKEKKVHSDCPKSKKRGMGE